MAPRNARNDFYILGSNSGNGNAGTQGMSEWIGLSLCRKYVGLDGVWIKCLISVGITLLLVPSIFAINGEIFWGYFVDNLFECPVSKPFCCVFMLNLNVRLLNVWISNNFKRTTLFGG